MRWTICLLLVAVATAACRGRAPEEDERSASLQRIDERGRVVLSKRERDAVGLTTAAAEEGSLTTSVLRYGKVVARPQEDVAVVAPITGRLIAPTIVLGAQVSTGDLLCAIEPLVDTASRASLEAQREELQGQVEGARAQVTAKASELARVTTLISSGLATDADKARAQADLTSEQARLDSMRRAAGELQRMTGGRLALRAPVPGVVATLASETGSLIQQGTVLARIVRVGPRWIDVAVPPGDRVGRAYRVRGMPDTVPADLLTRGAVVQPDGTRRDRLEAAPGTAASLPPGATVPVEVLHETKGLVLPAGAIVRRARERLVFVEVEEGRYEPRAVEVGASDDVRVVVTSGLERGDRAVTLGASALLGELGAGVQEANPGGRK